MKHRLFVALAPPAELVEALDEFWSARREAAPFRWTLPEQWHVTLAFLPAVSDHLLDDLADRLAAAVGRRTAFAVRVEGGGAFPAPESAKVLWAGLQGDPAALEELDRLARGARNAAVAGGTEVDGAGFRPHLTLARSRQPFEATRWLRVADAFVGPQWSVETVSLIASHLGEGPSKRPRYETVAEFELPR